MKKILYIFTIVIALVLFATGCKTAENDLPSTFDLPSSSDLPSSPAGSVPIELKPIKYTVKQKINVYFFWGDGCPHCAEAEILFNQIKDDYSDCYNLVAYETWKNPTNAAFLTQVFGKLNIAAADRGVPLFVMGDQYEIGYIEDMAQGILEKITNACSSDSYKDIIAPMLIRNN